MATVEEKIDLLIHKLQPKVEEFKSQYPVPEDEVKFITIPQINNPNLVDKFVIFTHWSLAYTYFFIKYKLFDKKQEFLSMVSPEEALFFLQNLSRENAIEVNEKLEVHYLPIYTEFLRKYNMNSEETIEKMNNKTLTVQDFVEDEKAKELAKEIFDI